MNSEESRNGFTVKRFYRVCLTFYLTEYTTLFRYTFFLLYLIFYTLYVLILPTASLCAFVTMLLKDESVESVIVMTSARDDDVTAAAVARYRLRQLVHQHPPHDSDVRHCTSLKSSVEKDELVEFDRQRRLHQLGRAQFFTTALNDHVNSNTRCKQV